MYTKERERKQETAVQRVTVENFSNECIGSKSAAETDDKRVTEDEGINKKPFKMKDNLNKKSFISYDCYILLEQQR